MMALLAVIWPRQAVQPTLVLAISYDPPRRPRRQAPAGIRASSLTASQTADLAALISSIPTMEDRR